MYAPDRNREGYRGHDKAGAKTIRIPARRGYQETGMSDDIGGQILESLPRDGHRRYWREQNENLAVWEPYDKPVAS